MKSTRRLLALVLSLAGLLPASGAEITACVVADNIQNNATYFGMATTVTQLKCEYAQEDYSPTLQQLYNQGWRLIEVVGGDHALSMGLRGPSPLYFLERSTTHAAPAAKIPAMKNGPAAASSGGANKPNAAKSEGIK